EPGGGEADLRTADGEQAVTARIGLETPGDQDVAAEDIGHAPPVLRLGQPAHRRWRARDIGLARGGEIVIGAEAGGDDGDDGKAAEEDGFLFHAPPQWPAG